MKRRLRTTDDLRQIFDKDPALKRLYDALDEIDNVIVQPDGTGASVFKVYLSHRMGRFESFLRVYRSLERSYVQWLHQGDHAKQCQELWGPVVKDPSNSDGSQLNRDVTVDTIVRIARQYADIATS
jgi:hypothetical protein